MHESIPMASVSRVEVIQFGSLSRQYGETGKFNSIKKALGVCGESSITLVQAVGKNILIDTGFRNEFDFSERTMKINERVIKGELEARDLEPSDVHEIFITHWHFDHFGNLHLFPGAVVRFAGIPEVDLAEILAFHEITNKVAEVRPGDPWHAGLELLPTPGHNSQHHSVIITFEGVTIVAAGDAIVSQSYYDHGAAWTRNSDFQSEALALDSMAKIRERAGIIIPGHGHPFENYLDEKR